MYFRCVIFSFHVKWTFPYMYIESLRRIWKVLTSWMSLCAEIGERRKEAFHYVTPWWILFVFVFGASDFSLWPWLAWDLQLSYYICLPAKGWQYRHAAPCQALLLGFEPFVCIVLKIKYMKFINKIYLFSHLFDWGSVPDAHRWSESSC